MFFSGTSNKARSVHNVVSTVSSVDTKGQVGESSQLGETKYSKGELEHSNPIAATTDCRLTLPCHPST